MRGETRRAVPIRGTATGLGAPAAEGSADPEQTVTYARAAHSRSRNQRTTHPRAREGRGTGPDEQERAFPLPAAVPRTRRIAP